ncbi:MAG: NADH-quinone oxidoreductase subunit J [Chloroflexi bacterium]|nr:NADH-quinone oxidoreductase subunit J [Chloroflexota bacterium]MBV9543932.1 NADH-quinone oxidoreductase subunit J [Chloroflexota bacterium]
MDDLFFPLLIGCIVALLSALGVLLARRPVYAAVALLVHSLSLAALFGILAAGMVAVGQILIYSGAIVVLFLFVVTLLPAGGLELAPQGNRIAAACVAAAAIVVALAVSLARGIPAPAPNFDLSVAAVGQALFGPLIGPFELTAPLLLVAIVGGVAIWRRHEPRPTIARKPQAATEPRKLVLHR